MQEYVAAIPIGVFLSFMIGPVFFVLLETAATKSIKEALLFDIGVLLGDTAFILIAYFSSYKLLMQLKDNPKLYFFGGAIMFVYGVFSLVQTKKEGIKSINNITLEPKSQNYKLVLKGFLLNFMNIGVLGFWLGILINIGPKLNMDGAKIALFFFITISSYFITDIGKVTLAKQLKKKLTPLRIFKIKKIVAWIIIIFGLFLIIKIYLPLDKIKIHF